MDSSRERNSIQNLKSIVAVCIALPVGLLHFVTGPSYSGPFPGFVNGYLIDILLPFALYFLLCPQDSKVRWLKPWYVKALPVLAIGVSVETAQAVGIEIFGNTFDPLDYAAYASGVFMAVAFDLWVFPLVFASWKKDRAGKGNPGR
mgnify:CR=1 FL=1